MGMGACGPCPAAATARQRGSGPSQLPMRHHPQQQCLTWRQLRGARHSPRRWRGADMWLSAAGGRSCPACATPAGLWEKREGWGQLRGLYQESGKQCFSLCKHCCRRGRLRPNSSAPGSHISPPGSSSSSVGGEGKAVDSAAAAPAPSPFACCCPPSAAACCLPLGAAAPPSACCSAPSGAGCAACWSQRSVKSVGR